MKKYIAIFLILAALFSLSACDGTKEPSGSDAAESGGISSGQLKIIKNGETEYKIVRSEKASAEDIKLISAFAAKIRDATGVQIPVSDDWINPYDENSVGQYEILVGDTNREESSSVSCERGGWIICARGEKIVIQGGSITAIGAALDYFVENYLGDRELAVSASLEKEGAADFAVGKVTLCGRDISEFTVVYTAETKSYADKFCAYLSASAGVILREKPSTGEVSQYEIIFGNIDRGDGVSGIIASMSEYDACYTTTNTRLYFCYFDTVMLGRVYSIFIKEHLSSPGENIIEPELCKIMDYVAYYIEK